jgi:hypothetical protein
MNDDNQTKNGEPAINRAYSLSTELVVQIWRNAMFDKESNQSSIKWL